MLHSIEASISDGFLSISCRSLRFDGGLIDKHNGNALFYRIDTMTLDALQAFFVGSEFDIGFTQRASEYVENFWINHFESHQNWYDIPLNFGSSIKPIFPEWSPDPFWSWPAGASRRQENSKLSLLQARGSAAG